MALGTAESFAVLGGEGFVGQAIVQGLLNSHPPQAVASFGLTQRTFTPSYRFFRTDVTSYDEVLASLRRSGATTVFHTVSPHPTASAEVCEQVNVRGTEAIIKACVAAGVTKLVFTSSVTVGFDSRDIVSADERLPSVEQSKDPYVATKSRAETLILDANGIGGLLTCALRFGGIFGPGDRQVLPGFIKVYHDGQTSFQMGSNQNLFDFVYIANVVHAHLLAAARLSSPPLPPSSFDTRLRPVSSTISPRVPPTSSSNPNHLAPPTLPAHRNRFDQFSPLYLDPSGVGVGVAGEVFVVSNGEPVPFWSFARAVWWEYAQHVPRVTVPLPPSVGLALATVAEWWAWLRGDTSMDGLTRVHVSYVVCSLYFNIEKARRVLGYEPVVSLEEGIKLAVAAFKTDETRAAAAKRV